MSQPPGREKGRNRNLLRVFIIRIQAHAALGKVSGTYVSGELLSVHMVSSLNITPVP